MHSVCFCTAIIAQAGEYRLRAALKGGKAAPAECQVACRAGPTSALHSRSDMTGFSDWRAGEPRKLLISRRDR